MTSKVQVNDQKKGLTVKDLIVTGVFSALIFVCINISGGIFCVMPTLTFYYPVGASLLAGPIFLLMLAKVPKHGPIIIVSILMGIFIFATGMHWAMGIGYIVMGIISDIIAGIKNFKNKKMNIIAYIFFCFGGTGSYLAYFINPQSWVSSMIGKGTPKDYLDAMQAATNLTV